MATEQEKQYQREYYLRNKEKISQRRKEYYIENKEHIDALQAEYRQENKEKISEYHRENYKKNKDEIRLYIAGWCLENKERLKESSRQWRQNNKDKVAGYWRKWASANTDKVCVLSGRKRATKLQATPSWADDFIISEVYDLAARRTKSTGIKWHVDHIVPLKSKLVCGLHCEANLRVITGSENVTKGNRHWPDMPS